MKSLIILLLAVVLTSCGAFKKTTNKSELEVTAKEVSILKAEVTANTATTTDKGIKTLITERIDTNVTIPGTTASVTRPLSEFIEKGIIEASNGETSVKVTYDPTTGSVKAEGKTAEKTVPVQSTKTTVVQEDYKSLEETRMEGSLTAKTESKVDVEQKEKDVVVEKESSNWLIFGVIAFFFVIVMLCGMYLFNRLTP